MSSIDYCQMGYTYAVALDLTLRIYPNVIVVVIVLIVAIIVYNSWWKREMTFARYGCETLKPTQLLAGANARKRTTRFHNSVTDVNARVHALAHSPLVSIL